MGRVASHTSPFTLAANTFRANPSLIDFAISNPVVPSLYSRTFPSGKVILIILRLPFFVDRLYKPISVGVVFPEERQI
jgi:hypothetical protein